MTFTIIVISLLAITVCWLVFRASIDRSYVKGRYKSNRRKKWDLKSDGHIEAEEAVLDEQMKIRLEYYQKTKDNPPDIFSVRGVIITSDDMNTAKAAFEGLEVALEGFDKQPVKAIALLNKGDYKSMWHLSGLSDIVKSAIFDQFSGETIFIKEYGVIAAPIDDIKGVLSILSGMKRNS